MDRPIIYSMQLPRSADFLQTQKNVLRAIGQVAADAMLSASAPAVMTGLACTATGPASLGVNLGPGAVYQAGVMDATAYGSLPIDATAVTQQGISTASQLVTGFASPGIAGQSIAYLIQVQFQSVDGSPILLNYYNAANIPVPFIGPGGAGTTQNTARTGALVVQVLAGTAATTGTQTTPAVTAGWLPAYVVTVAFGQTTVTAGNIAIHPSAPFLAALTSQHHLGLPGTAPKINLTQEVQGLLPLANTSLLPTSQLLELQCSAGAGLVLNYNAGTVLLAGVSTAITPGTLALTASNTNYVYISAAGVVAFNTTGFPVAGVLLPLAIVTTGGAAITLVTDKRPLFTGSGNTVTASGPIQAVTTNGSTALTLNPITPAFLNDMTATAGAGLSLNYSAGTVLISGVSTSIAASAITLTASATNYVFVNAAGAVTSNTTGFPSAVIYPIAQVTTSGAAITGVTDKRPWLTASGPATAAGVTSLANGTGIGLSGSTGAVTVSNTGVTSAVAGTGVGVNASTGAVTFSNTGVTSLAGGTGLGVSASTGGVTLSNTGVTSLAAGAGIGLSGSTGAVTITNTNSLTSGFRAYQSAAQGALTNSGWLKITFQTSVYDALSEFNTGTSRFTANAAGTYTFGASIDLTSITTNGYYIAALYVNGARHTDIGLMTATSGTAGPTLSFAGSVPALKLAAGDYVELYVFASAAASVTTSATSCYFTGARIQ